MRFQFFLLITFLMLSCSSQEEEIRPENVLEPEDFAVVMIDVQITEGMRAQGVDIITPAQGVDGPYDKIFKKHSISQDVFERSYDYYLERPDRMEKIYEQVLDSLSKLDAEVKQKFSAERKARADSIKNASSKN